MATEVQKLGATVVIEQPRNAQALSDAPLRAWRSGCEGGAGGTCRLSQIQQEEGVVTGSECNVQFLVS